MKTNIFSLQQRRGLNLLILFSFLLAAFATFADASENLPGGGLTRADAKYVCMINNQLFNKVQIPVVVDGKTYYGCCRMCEETLNKDPQSHFAVDPVSGKRVDKATAVIGVSHDGQAFYFENEEHMTSFTPPVKP